MVMEASPSPQSVGREFVRQYYTLLNKAPAHLHRFYNNYSSFVHGGLDAPNRETLPVVGQKQIHNRIQQLNFRDCHAKISQVDSQATLGNGVVVQVTGELSNGGAPMRRFTQTFVLAAQSPKKYYVHNDIFRYQDIVFSDEEGSASGRSEGEEEESGGSGGVGGGYFPPPPATFPAPFPAPPRLEPEPPVPAPPVAAPPAPVTDHHLNGHPPQNDDATRHLVSAIQATSVSGGEHGERGEPARAPTPPPPRDPTPPPTPTPQPPSPPAAPEPKTYANLLKSGSGAAHARVSPPQQQPPSHAAYAPSHASHAPSHATHVSGLAGDSRVRARPQRDALSNDGPSNAGGPGSGPRRYSDAQQLFLGNLPHAATEDELRVLFARFGPVAELRVHCKPAPPGQPKHPNYGFITYETTQAVVECLAAAPLFYPAEGVEGCVKLNVEEKKARAAPPAPRRRPPSQPRRDPAAHPAAMHPPHPRAAQPYRR